MADMSFTKNPMPSQAPDIRKNNFDEVALGYTAELALAEADRCLHCKNTPCILGCPVQINISEFIGKIKDKDFEGAYDVIARSSSLPAICGRVCPQENQCESKCTRGIKGEPVAIGRLERFVADYHNTHGNKCEQKKIKKNGHKVAVIGSGPAGLACAGELAGKGYDVTVFEALHTAGGVLVYGIPEFRLPKSIVKTEIEGLKRLGVKIETNILIGKTITVDELRDKYGFEALFIGTGAGLPRFMNIPGENLKGVYSANEFLTRINLMKAYREKNDTPVMHAKKVVVVGGGNVAMDSARCARRLGADVTICYRRSEEELPARREEVEHAREEGIEFRFLTNPLKINGYNNPEDRRDPKNGTVISMECIRMELGEPDEKGRRSPVEIPGSEFAFDCDCVIMAIGTSPNPLIKNTTAGLEFSKKGGIVADEDGLTSLDGVYAGGDAVTGSATVILAMGAGKRAARAIDRKFNEQKRNLNEKEF